MESPAPYSLLCIHFRSHPSGAPKCLLSPLSPPFPPSVPFHHSFSFAIPLLISSPQACVPFSTFPHNTNTKKILHLCLFLTVPCLLPAACTLELWSPPVTVRAIHACGRPLPEAQKGLQLPDLLVASMEHLCSTLPPPCLACNCVLVPSDP